MTFAEMGEKTVTDTEAQIKQFNKLIAGEYQTALTDINKDIRKIYDRVIGDRSPAEVAKLLKDQPSWLWVEANKFGRLQTLQKKIQSEYVKASIKAGHMTVESSKTALSNNFYQRQFSLDFANNTGVPLSFAVLNPKVAELSILGTPLVFKGLQKKTIDKIKKTYGKPGAYQPQYGTLANVLKDNRAKDLLKIRQSLTQGLIQGKSYVKTAKEMQKVLDGSVSQALRVVRTESGRLINTANYASSNIAQSKGLDVDRQIISTLDDRTREQSQIVDAQISDENNQFTYPGGVKVDIPGNSGVAKWDINDREVTIQVIEGESPETRTGKNPHTGKSEVMSFKSYNEWMEGHGFKKNKTGRWVLKSKTLTK